MAQNENVPNRPARKLLKGALALLGLLASTPLAITVAILVAPAGFIPNHSVGWILPPSAGVLGGLIGYRVRPSASKVLAGLFFGLYNVPWCLRQVVYCKPCMVGEECPTCVTWGVVIAESLGLAGFLFSVTVLVRVLLEWGRRRVRGDG